MRNNCSPDQREGEDGGREGRRVRTEKMLFEIYKTLLSLGSEAYDPDRVKNSHVSVG